MNRECAWCKVDLGEADGPSDKTTHGICDECRYEIRVQIVESSNIPTFSHDSLERLGNVFRSYVAKMTFEQYLDWLLTVGYTDSLGNYHHGEKPYRG